MAKFKENETGFVWEDALARSETLKANISEATRYAHFSEAERYHHEAAAWVSLIQWGKETATYDAVKEDLRKALLSSAIHVAADRPNYIALVRVYAEALRLLSLLTGPLV